MTVAASVELGRGWMCCIRLLEDRSRGQTGRARSSRKPLPQFESGTWRYGHYGSQLEGVRASIDKKAGKLQNYRSVCPSVDGRGLQGAFRPSSGRSISANTTH